jgi:hypothetical protein
MAPGHRRPDRQQVATGSRRRPVTLIVVGVIVVGLLAVTGLAALLRGGDDGRDGSATAVSTSSPQTSVGGASPSASSASSQASGQVTPSPTSKPTSSATPSETTHVAGTYTGHGNKVVKIAKPGNLGEPALIVATHPGGGSFGVLALDSTLHETDILINVAGSYHGTTLLDAQGAQTQNLQVRAHGAWTLKIKPVTAARSVDARAAGTSDDVLRYTGTTGLATFDCRGGLNFVVTYYGQKNAVLVNEIGRYHGQVALEKGPALISVKANAAWSMNVAP